MVSIYNFENTWSKLKPDHINCCINVFIEEAGICSMIDIGEKGNKLTEKILFNFLFLYSPLISFPCTWGKQNT